VVAQTPELKNVEPFKTVLSGNREAIAKLSMKQLEEVLAATLTGMTVDEFSAEVKTWIETAKHPRWDRLYTELTYQPMQEVLLYLRPYAAFGNSTGDRQMLEYTTAGDGARLAMLVLHDDASREYAYGPANGLPDTRVGTFTQALYDEAGHKGWTVVSMKDDWKEVFPSTVSRAIK
jgi:hypothetical protein